MPVVNIGAASNDGTGDPLRAAFGKVNTDAEAMRLALRDAGILTLSGIAGTGDAVTALLPASMSNVGITTLSAVSQVEYIPTQTNASANPVISINGVPYSVRDADGADWPANGFVVGRSHILRRHNSVLRVISGREFQSGAVWHTSITAIATLRPPSTAGQISIASDNGQITWRVLATAPSTPDPLIHAQTLDGRWWRLSESSVAIKNSLAQLSSSVFALNVAMPGGTMDRGDAAILATVNGQVVAGFDASGHFVAAAAQALIDSIFGGATPAQADALARASAYVQGLILDTVLERGDVAELARMNGNNVIAILPSGHVELRLSDDAVADVRARLDLDQLVALSAPLAADLAGDYDAWDVWQRGDLTYFTGNLWGASPRGYVRRGAGLPWAVAPSVMPLRLVTGDHVANALPSAQPDRWAHIATLGDGADQDGLDGAVPSGPAEDFARAGAGFAALSADRGLAARTGALARYGVRSEAVEGATLAQLASGQPLANLVRARSEFARLAALYGGQVATESVTVLHSGGATSITAYRDDLVALAGALVEQVGAAQVNVIPPAGTWASGSDPAILGAVEALRTRGAVPLVLPSPIHWCAVRTGTLATPDAAAMTMLAELDALATAAGTGWHGPVPYQAVRSGNTILVDCEVMPGADLVAPTYGVRYSGAAITAMAVVAEPLTGRMMRLQITLASAAAGTMSIAYGATGTDQAQFANRCDLRDSWGAPSVTGQTLRRYTHSARFEVA